MDHITQGCGSAPLNPGGTGWIPSAHLTAETGGTARDRYSRTVSDTPQIASRRGSRRPRQGNKWLGRLGLVLVLTGLVLIGYVGWQMFGTNWVSQKRHNAAIESLEKQWATGAEDATTDHGTAQAIIRIPRFGDDYAVPLLKGTSDEVLASGIGHFDGSARPGGKGNFSLAGHRVTHGEPLRGMPELKVGDEIIVETRSKIFTYVLDTGGADLEVPFTETWVLDRIPQNPREGGVQPAQKKGQRLLTLTTCAELFHTDQRMIAFGTLVDTQDRTTA